MGVDRTSEFGDRASEKRLLECMDRFYSVVSERVGARDKNGGNG